MYRDQFLWLDILLGHDSIAAYLAMAMIFSIPFLLFLSAFQVLVLICTRSARSEGGSYMTLGFEAFLQSTRRIELDSEAGDADEDADEPESLLSNRDDDDEKKV